MQLDTIRMEDSLVVNDTLSGVKNVQNKIFTGESIKSTHNFPFTDLLNRDLSPDWILIISIFVLAIFAWINVIYTRFIGNIFKSTVNYQVSQRLYNDPNLVQKRISSLFVVIYFITGGLYLFLVYDYFSPGWFPYSDIKLFFIFTGFILSFWLLRIILYKLTGLIFDQLKKFNEGIFHNSLFNKLAGIVFVPFIILIAYTRDIFLDIAVYLSLIVFAGLILLRIWRGGIFIAKNVVSLFYFILYLCSLEILPVMVVLKLILHLAKVS